MITLAPTHIQRLVRFMRTHRPSTRVVIAVAAALAVTATLALTFAVAPEAHAQTESVDKPRLSIPIPDLKFSNLKVTDANGTRTIDVPWIAQYIAAVFRYGVGIAGFLAAVMFMIGGMQYLTAGDSGRVAKAKKRITDALTGLILLLSTYALLNVVNPELVKLSALQITTVKRTPFPANETDPNDVVLSPSEQAPPVQSGGPIEPVGNPVPIQHIGQCEGAYKNIPYNDSSGQCSNFTLCTSGCGIAAAAMVIGAQTGRTPSVQFVTDLIADARNYGFRPCTPSSAPQCPASACNGTAGGFFTSPNVLAKYGLKGEQISGKEVIIDHLERGHPIVAVMRRSIFTSQGHFVVLAGINTNGTIRVVDPGKCATCGYSCDRSKSGNSEKGCPDPVQKIPTIPQNAVPQSYVFSALTGAWYISPVQAP